MGNNLVQSFKPFNHMKNISDNVLVLEMGEQIPPGSEDAIKILLVGTESIDGPTANPNGEPSTYDWQSKFAQGVATISNPSDGLIMFKSAKYLIMNSKYIPVMTPDPMMPENAELMNKYNWILDMANAADIVFCNILKKTTSPIPLMEFGLFAPSQKLVMRCPESYPYFQLVKLICERSKIPLLQSKSTVKDALFSAYSFCKRFQELQRYQLPE